MELTAETPVLVNCIAAELTLACVEALGRGARVVQRPPERRHIEPAVGPHLRERRAVATVGASTIGGCRGTGVNHLGAVCVATVASGTS